MSLIPYSPLFYQPFHHYDNWVHGEMEALQRELGMVEETKEGDFKYTCSVHGFKPDELDVHQEGDNLIIEGHQKHTGPLENCERTVKRIIHLPGDVHGETVRCELNEKGELTVHAIKKVIEERQKRAIPVHWKPLNEAKH